MLIMLIQTHKKSVFDLTDEFKLNGKDNNMRKAEAEANPKLLSCLTYPSLGTGFGMSDWQLVELSE